MLRSALGLGILTLGFMGLGLFSRLICNQIINCMTGFDWLHSVGCELASFVPELMKSRAL